MLLVVDANVIIKDPMLRDRKWQAAHDAICANRLRLILPEVARLEAIGGYRRHHEEKIQQVKSVIRKSTTRAKNAASALLQAYTEEIVEYESLLETRLHEIGFEIWDPPAHTHLELTERAVNRLAPFDHDGGGYRDTLLWLTGLERIAEAPFDNLILLTDDDVFTKRSSDLSEELRRETDGELTVVRSISSIEFPGEYESGDFDLASLGDVNTDDIVRQITQVLTRLDITQWSPPGPDHAQVKLIGRVELLMETLQVKKRYGSDIFEIIIEAIADVDADILVIGDSNDGADFSQWEARWNLRVRWRGETELAESIPTQFGDGFTIEVLGLDERNSTPRRV